MITKTDWRSMMLLAFSVCAEDGTLVAVGNAEELKGIKAKKIRLKMRS